MGGGGHFGLWLDEALEYGSSNASQTYGNAPLGSEESFRWIKRTKSVGKDSHFLA